MGSLPLDKVELSHPFHSTGDGKARRRRHALIAVLRPLAVATLLLGAVGVVVLLPVRFPSGVDTYATISPAHQWVLSKATDGQLVASTFNYESGMNEGFRVSTFSQGGSVHFSLHPSLGPGRAVAVGDTIGSIYSSDVAERLISLNGQLTAARSMLAVNSTGQKSAVVNESEQRLRFALRRREEHRKVEERHQLLFDQHLISQGEYDRVQNEANALQDEIAIAESNLEAARTGAKPEQLDLAQANIVALESEIEAVRRRAGTYTVTAPIAGTIIPSFSENTLVTIAAEEYVALVPIPRVDYPRVVATPRPQLVFSGLSQSVHGSLISMGRELQMLHGREVLIATARLEAPPPDVMPGMLVRCRIGCSPVTAVEYGTYLFRSMRASTVSF